MPASVIYFQADMIPNICTFVFLKYEYFTGGRGMLLQKLLSYERHVCNKGKIYVLKALLPSITQLAIQGVLKKQ